MSPQPDVRPNIKVSEHENSTDYDMCKNCGDLKPLGSAECHCGLTNVQVDNLYRKGIRQ